MNDFEAKLARFNATRDAPKAFTPRTTAFRFSRRLSPDELAAVAERTRLARRKRAEFERSFPSPKSRV